MTERYNDIIELPHHTSSKRPRMPQHDRAAQFAPFAALVGYGDDVKESARLTDAKIELDDYEKSALDMRLRILQEDPAGAPEVTVTYFLPDERKAGGSYVSVTGKVKRIDTVKSVVIMECGVIIPIDDIYGIDGDGELFRDIM